MTFRILALTSVALGGALATAALAAPKPAAKPALTMAQARAIAQKAVKGTIEASELEAEKGGSGLRYSFDVLTASGPREVGIDARTGAVLENAAEGKHPD
jgi:uncharacterized membrane protein YkoI